MSSRPRGYPRDVIFDTTEATFEQDVVERSHEHPVVVDFWAEWCGPCRQLTPVLEKLVTERDGEVHLAKLDTDANQQLAAAFGIQGIPAVKAFKDGQVVAEFVGAQPPANVQRFLDALVPSQADARVEAGDEQSLREALALEPGRADAAVPLARLLHERGEDDEALELLGNVAGSFAADGLAARIRLEQDPDLARAFAALDSGDTESGLDGLIGAISATDGDRREDLRRAVVGELDTLGVQHPVARDARRKLASALY
jgi:putative thioredoxin